VKTGASFRLFLRCLAICAAAMATVSPGQLQTPAPLRHCRLNVVVTRGAMGAINTADAQAAGTVWMQSIGRRRGFQLDTRFEILPNVEAIQARVKESSADFVILAVTEYFQLAPLGLLQPFVAVAHGNAGAAQSYHLIVNRGATASSIAGLRGKSVITCSNSDLDLGRIWTETLLNDEHLGRADRFFGSVTHASKPSSACLPVFFGKADACVVNAAGWEILSEMNPQMAVKLRLIASSPAYLEALGCVHVNFREFREELLQGLLELHRDPEGRQLLMVFKAGSVVAITDRDAASARELWARYINFAGRPEPVKAAELQISGRP